MNDIEEIPLLLENDAATLDDEGWALIAPFGEHPKTRVVKKNGTLVEEKFIQVLDTESADQLLSRENSLFRRIRRAVVGIPVYKGHPDLRDYAPETAGAAVKKEIIGTIDRVRKTGRGMAAHFVLTPAGADAVENEGCKYPSALWLAQPIGKRGDATLARPFKLLSAGLTAHPNISGVESLANTLTRPDGHRLPSDGRGQSEGQPQQKEPDMKLIAGWLLAQGAALANAESPTESQVLEALQKLHTAKAGEVTSLGNEKSTLAGENTDLKSQISNLNSTSRALENEKADLKAQIASLKSGRATTVVDLAIARGKLNVAERGARIEALGNAQDFEKEAAALLGSATRYRTAGSAESGKILSNQGTDGDPREEYCASVERHMKETGETDPIKAHHAVMQRNPGLAEKLKVRSQFQS
jgi:cell division protein FtsB